MLVLRRSDVAATPRWAARDPYARVVNIGTNNDGHTKEGITFPSSDAQGQLARQVGSDVFRLKQNMHASPVSLAFGFKTVVEVPLPHAP